MSGQHGNFQNEHNHREQLKLTTPLENEMVPKMDDTIGNLNLEEFSKFDFFTRTDLN